jgi:hypothetical protein
MTGATLLTGDERITAAPATRCEIRVQVGAPQRPRAGFREAWQPKTQANSKPSFHQHEIPCRWHRRTVLV